MANISPFAFFQLLDNNGDPLSGGKLYTYEAGTSTPKITYTSEDESTANANPIILDSGGRADVWLAEGEYKFVLTDSSDNAVDTIDNVVGSSAGARVYYSITGTTSITSVYNDARIFANGTLTLSLLPAADAEEGFEFVVKNVGSTNVTIDPDASETINGSATFTLPPNESVAVFCNGTTWFTTYELGDNTVTTAKIADSSVTKQKIEDIADYKVLGNVSGSANAPAEVSILDEDDMSSDSPTSLATQQSIKAYVDAAGSVINISSVVKTDTYTHSSGTTFTDITDLSITVTPQSTSSKFLIVAMLNVGTNTGTNNWAAIKAVRNSTDIGIGDAAGSRVRATASADPTDLNNVVPVTVVVQDAPATVSSTTYKLQIASQAAGESYINRTGSDTDSGVSTRTASTMLLIEYK